MPFLCWKLNDEHKLTVLVKGGRYIFKLQGEEGVRQNLSPQRSVCGGGQLFLDMKEDS